jgi:hypothetical protein
MKLKEYRGYLVEAEAFFNDTNNEKAGGVDAPAVRRPLNKGVKKAPSKLIEDFTEALSSDAQSGALGLADVKTQADYDNILETQTQELIALWNNRKDKSVKPLPWHSGHESAAHIAALASRNCTRGPHMRPCNPE